MRSKAVPVLLAVGSAMLVAACSSAQPATLTSTRTSTTPTATSARPTPTTSSAMSSTQPIARPSTHARTSDRPHVVLPLPLPTHDATQVITVTASRTGSTTAILQAWGKRAGEWHRYGGPVLAHLGSQGLTRHANEGASATPIGSFTLTQAFGHDPNPGTRVKYTHTTPADWWISQPGPLYNTRQRCSSGCSFNPGDPNEHLYYETPYYNYAVVIDYNTRNAPGGVRQDAGSAFFLHVTDGGPTAGCVSIPQDRLVHLMRWLDPSRHPRILIGVG